MKKSMPFLGVITLLAVCLQAGCRTDSLLGPVEGGSGRQVIEGMAVREAGEAGSKEGLIIRDADRWKESPYHDGTMDGEGDGGGDDDDNQGADTKKDTKETDAARVKREIKGSIGEFLQMWRDR